MAHLIIMALHIYISLASTTAVSNRNKMQPTYIILKFMIWPKLILALPFTYNVYKQIACLVFLWLTSHVLEFDLTPNQPSRQKSSSVKIVRSPCCKGIKTINKVSLRNIKKF